MTNLRQGPRERQDLRPAIDTLRYAAALVVVAAGIAVYTGRSRMMRPPTSAGRAELAVAGAPDDPPYRFRGSLAPPIDGSLPHAVSYACAVVRHCELTTANAPWQIFHGIQAFGKGFTLTDLRTGRQLNAVDYLLDGFHYHNEIVREPMVMDPGGQLSVRTEDRPQRAEDHPGQLLFILSQAGVPLSQPITLLTGERRSIADLLSAEAKRVYREEELSWLLPSLYYYCYAAKQSSRLHTDMDSLLRREVDEGFNWSICNGTHTAFALAYLLKQHRARNLVAVGPWHEAEVLLARHVALARKYQNSDGSFASSWSYQQTQGESLEVRVNVTGHMLAWLALAVPQPELEKPWLQRSVRFLAQALPQAVYAGVSYGALSHGAHGLRMYQQLRSPRP